MNNFFMTLVSPLGALMNLCYGWVSNYGWAIVLFTLITKVILAPVSVWVHRNSIKMIRLQPEINRIKARFFGDADRIADAQSELYKREKYNPLASLIPLAIQILLLIGLINVIYHPLTFILHLPEESIGALTALTAQLLNIDPATASIELSVVEAVRNSAYAADFAALGMDSTLATITAFNTTWFGVDVSWIPSMRQGLLILAPILAGLSALLLSLIQNRQNVLQAEQGKLGQYGTMALSVGLSLYLGWFVPVGVALYWIFSNLFAIVQQFILNRVISPKKYVDFAELEASKKELDELQNLGGEKKGLFHRDEYAAREKADYKRFFSIANKHLVFYSEKSGFYKYFEGVIQHLLDNSNITIHYVTSDPDDIIFKKAEQNARIKPYYIGEKRLITLMMKMDADMVVMTVPDLNNFHIKRSYVREDIEYVYMFHALLVGMRTLRKGALDHFDTVLCEGPVQAEEIRAIERATGAKEKKLVPCGYSLIDNLARDYEAMPKTPCDRKRILIAPSWQEANILDSCLSDLLDALLPLGYDITVRPHPQYVKRFGPRWDALIQSCAHYDQNRLTFESDFSSNESVYAADLLITDWSGIGYEYAISTKKPALFIDTPMKVVNEDLRLPEGTLDIPLDIQLRTVIGKALKPAEIKTTAADAVKDLFASKDAYSDAIEAVRREQIFHFGESATVEAQYILESLTTKK